MKNYIDKILNLSNSDIVRKEALAKTLDNIVKKKVGIIKN